MLRGEEREYVGALEIGGSIPNVGTITLSLVCHAVLTAAQRAKAVEEARLFLDELATQWSLQITETAESGLVEQPDGTFQLVTEFRAE